MAYATENQVETAVGGSKNLLQLTDLEDVGAVDSAVVDMAISEADGIINSYIGQRFSVPLATVPDSVSRLSARWAGRILRSNRYQGAPVEADIKAEDMDREWLKGVAKGIVSLGIEPTPLRASIVVDKAAARDSTLTTSRERLKGFI